MSDDIFAQDFNLWLAEHNSSDILQDDASLRFLGFPQQLIQVLRASGLSTADIVALPIPRTDSTGFVLDEYWEDLKSRGVNS